MILAQRQFIYSWSAPFFDFPLLRAVGDEVGETSIVQTLYSASFFSSQTYTREALLSVLRPLNTPIMASVSEQAAELAKLPGLPPPSANIIPNFADPYNRAYLVTFTTAITLTLATLLILIRTYTKYAINKIGLGWDDCELI